VAVGIDAADHRFHAHIGRRQSGQLDRGAYGKGLSTGNYAGSLPATKARDPRLTDPRVPVRLVAELITPAVPRLVRAGCTFGHVFEPCAGSRTGRRESTIATP
jgi:hypothetical protein